MNIPQCRGLIVLPRILITFYLLGLLKLFLVLFQAGHIPMLQPIHDRGAMGHRNGWPGAMLCVLGLSALVGGCSTGEGIAFWDKGTRQGRIETVEVARGEFDHVILDQGQVESSAGINIECKVKMQGRGGIPILWVVEEGKEVRRGEKLVELDASLFEDQLKQQIQNVALAQANVIQAEANVETARIALEQYLQGEYVIARKDLLSQIAIAEQQLRNSDVALINAKRLEGRGLMTPLQIEAVEFDRRAALDQLEKARTDLRVLDELISQRNRVQLQSNIDAAKAQLESAQLRLREEEQELENIREQIANCEIVAPADGIVVYNNVQSGPGRGGSEFVVEEGALVRERQVILKLPDLNKMRVRAQVNESRIRFLEPGMNAIVQVEGVEGEMIGKVTRVARYSLPGAWYSSVREYEVWVEILNPLPAIRSGMTAEIRIFAAHLDDATVVPLNAMYEYRDHLYCLRRGDGNRWETVEVLLRATDLDSAAIEAGVSPGDVLVLNPGKHLDLFNFPDELPADALAAKAP
ncbi:MAG: HlyD family efflux transporter periplasmic adaptor subunit [Planctomycetota bacterium]|nr:MAG: HlyD family efflux transporter periplasmic adaptor subunit [Planctomycetota bacterium]